MKTHALLAATAAFLTATAVPTAAQTLTGTWSVRSETQRGTQNITLELVQDGEELTGTVTMAPGGRRGGRGAAAGRTFTIEEGRVEGSAFSFRYSVDFGGSGFTLDFSGTWEGDEMEGRIDGGRGGGGRPFTGTRGG